MSLVFIFLYATNQGKGLTLKGTCDFQTKPIRKNGNGSVWLDKTQKNVFTTNKPKENKHQALAWGTKGYKCKEERENMSFSRSPTSKSERLRQKFKFQEKGLVVLRTNEIVLF